MRASTCFAKLSLLLLRQLGLDRVDADVARKATALLVARQSAKLEEKNRRRH